MLRLFSLMLCTIHWSLIHVTWWACHPCIKASQFGTKIANYQLSSTEHIPCTHWMSTVSDVQRIGMFVTTFLLHCTWPQPFTYSLIIIIIFLKMYNDNKHACRSLIPPCICRQWIPLRPFLNRLEMRLQTHHPFLTNIFGQRRAWPARLYALMYVL